MAASRLHTLRARLLLLVLAVVLPGLGLTAWIGLESRESDRRAALNVASRTALLVAGNGKALLESGHQMLIALAELPALKQRDRTLCQGYFARLLDHYPNYANFFAVNLDGSILCSALKADPGLNLADRSWFKRVVSQGKFTISEPLPGCVSKKRVVVLALPVADHRGELAAVVGIALDMSWLNRLVTDIPLPEGATVAAIDRNGRFLAREPPDVAAKEMGIPDAHRIMPELLATGRAEVQAVGIDGVERLYSFSPLISEPGGEVFVRVGIPTAAVCAVAARQLARNLGLFGVAAALGLLFARLFADAFILKPAGRVLTAVRALGAGELSARADTREDRGEIAEIGRAVNAMAEALEDRDRRLAEAEAGYRGIFENAVEGIFQTTPEGRFRAANPALARMLGYGGPEQLMAEVTDVGRQLYADPEERKKVLARISADGYASGIEVTLRRRDGSLRDIELSARAVLGPDGRAAYFEGFFTDVTERRRMQEALRNSEALYRSVVEDQTELICRFLPDGTLTFVNGAYCRFFGRQAAEVVGRSLFEVVPQEECAPLRRRLAEVSPERPVVTVEHPVQAASGETRWVRWTDRGIFDAENRLVKYQSVGVDVTERRRAEAALRESEEKHRNLVERAADGIQIVQDGRIAFVNPAMAAMLGYARVELEGRPYLDVVHPDEAERIKDRVTRRLAGEIFPNTTETVLLTKDGREVQVEANAGLVSYNGRPADMVIVRDVTERKRAEALRQEVERMIRHDLKSPLNGILNLPQLVMAQQNLSEEQIELLNTIQEAGERMLRIVNQSLDLFKMEAGAYVLAPSSVELVHLLRAIAAENRRLMEAKGVSLSVLARGEPAQGRVFPIQSDESLCHSLLANLVQNAVEAAPEGSTVTVRLSEDQNWIIEVHNLGSVPEGIRERFFDKYVTAGKRRGTGLGTYIARLVAEVHRGRIRMETSEEGGTTVTVTLPKLNGYICVP
jgi:PAS domain S-box-containing protein